MLAMQRALIVALIAIGSARRSFPEARQRTNTLVARRAPQTIQRAPLGGRRIIGRSDRGRLLSLRGGDAAVAVPTGLGLEVPRSNLEERVTKSSSGSSVGRLKRWLLSSRGGATVQDALKAPLSMPPLTRSWLSIVLGIAFLSATGKLDLQDIATGGPMLRKGEWWRAILNFFFMGDSVKSIFFWFQMMNSYDFFKTLEVTKYRWEPMEMIKMIFGNAVMISLLRLLFPWNVYLGAPLASAFLYLYTREMGSVPMNFLGFLSIPTGWLPYMQMIQDLLQTGDITPNLLGLVSGHIYYFFREVLPLTSKEEKTGLGNLVKLFFHGQADVIDWSDYHDDSDDPNPSKVASDRFDDEHLEVDDDVSPIVDRDDDDSEVAQLPAVSESQDLEVPGTLEDSSPDDEAPELPSSTTSKNDELDDIEYGGVVDSVDSDLDDLEDSFEEDDLLDLGTLLD